MKAIECVCGAVTVEAVIDGERVVNSMLRETFDKEFPDTRIANEQYFACNHCANHAGVDICMCGSGEKYQECQGGFDCCGQPAETLGENKVWNMRFGT